MCIRDSPLSDLAIIQIEADEALSTVKMGNSDKLSVGEWVIAIGSPFGLHLNHTVTAGIVSATGRSSVMSKLTYEDFIQHDAAINPGNSGGALLNLDGELIGINTAIATDGYSRSNAGVGFAIPINQARRVVEDLLEDGTVSRGWLGVQIQNISEEISKVFVEIVLAPSFTKEALEIFSTKKNLRVLEIGSMKPREKLLEIRNIVGGIIVQETDTSVIQKQDLKTVTTAKPSDSEVETMLFGWKVLKHIKSNGILIVKDNTTVGVGAGQVSRVDSVDIAMKKSGENIQGSILCSDAFFPFRDSIDKISNSGIKAVLQPGGSVRDNEVIEACNEHGIAMVFTGQRCFKH